MSSSSESIRSLVPIALRLADAAAEVTLTHFRSASLSTDNKLDAGFDPVTIADKGAEAAMRDILAIERPGDGVFGEEQERTFGSSGLTWVLDPIDGTRAYISGLPVWGTLIALDDGTEGRIGIVDQPYLRERFVGVLDGAVSEAWLQRGEERTAISTRRDRGLSDAILFTTDADLFEGPERQAFANVRAQAKLTRYGTDCYAYALLAMGQIDLVIESGLAAYDVASHVPLIRAAGGIVTNWEGGDCRWGGRVVAAGSAELHAEVLEILSKTG
ncbi:MAG: histidinol-phosphatase [Pseudomonadota bacterium]